MAQSQDLNIIWTEKIQPEVEKIVAEAGGIVGVVVVDLEGDRRLSINGGKVYPQASAIKVPILMEVFKQAHEGKFALTDRIEVTEEFQVGGSGIIDRFQAGQSALSVRDLAMLMIVLSDNSATNILIDLVSMESVNATMTEIGAVDTKLRRVMMDTEASARGEENVSTPADAARIMEMLHRGEFVNEEVSEGVLEILRLDKGGNLKHGLDPGTKMASKPGGIPGVATEWAVVELEGRPYVISVMEKFMPLEKAGEPTKAVSKAVFRWFALAARSNEYGALTDSSLWERR